MAVDGLRAILGHGSAAPYLNIKTNGIEHAQQEVPGWGMQFESSKAEVASIDRNQFSYDLNHRRRH
jgi:hypothetical protein